MSHFANASIRIAVINGDEAVKKELAARLFHKMYSIDKDTNVSDDAEIIIYPISVRDWVEIVEDFSEKNGAELSIHYYCPDGANGHVVEGIVVRGRLEVTYDSDLDARIIPDEYFVPDEEFADYEARLYQIGEYDWKKERPEGYIATVMISEKHGKVQNHLFDVTRADSFYDVGADEIIEDAFLLFLAQQSKYPRLNHAVNEATFITPNFDTCYDLLGNIKSKKDYDSGYIVGVFIVDEKTMMNK